VGECFDVAFEPAELTDPVVADRQPQGRVGCVEFDVHDRGAGVLDGVGQRLRYRVVRRDLYLSWQPPSGAQVQLDRYSAPAGQRFERRCQALLGKDRGVDAAGDLPHPIMYVSDLLGDARQVAF
jgi:hypothetical protein